MIEYPQHNQLPDEYIIGKIADFLVEDLPEGDKTTEGIITESVTISAEFQAGEGLVFAGEKILPYCFGENCQTTLNHNDGDILSIGDVIGVVMGSGREILSRERVMLNLIQRLCGIATFTRKYAEMANPFNVKILDTRKTTPGLRVFEKYAVAVGGGFNHRLNLSDGILIKDNHIIAAGSVTKAIESVRKAGANLPLEIEVDNTNQIREALETNVDGFLLDNMNPQTIKDSVSLIRASENGNDIFVEASGGITLENIRPYLETGIDAISIGALTHQAVSKDIRLNFIT